MVCFVSLDCISDYMKYNFKRRIEYWKVVNCIKVRRNNTIEIAYLGLVLFWYRLRKNSDFFALNLRCLYIFKSNEFIYYLCWCKVVHIILIQPTLCCNQPSCQCTKPVRITYTNGLKFDHKKIVQTVRKIQNLLQKLYGLYTNTLLYNKLLSQNLLF